MGISAHVGHFEGLAGRKKHCRAWAFFRAFSKVVWAGPKNTEFDYILGKKWDMSFLFGHKSGHFWRGRCRKKAKYWAFRAFSSEIVVGRMSGIFRQILGIFRANHLVTLDVPESRNCKFTDIYFTSAHLGQRYLLYFLRV